MFKDGILTLRPCNGNNFSVAVTGDVNPANGVEEMVLAGKSAEILQGIQPALDKADLRIIQWETVISDTEAPITKCGPNLRVPVGCEDFIKAGKFDVALLANNHVGDHAPSGALDTIRNIEKIGVKTVGAGATAAEAAKPLHLEVNGLKLSIINACEMEFGTAWGDVPGTNAMDELLLPIQIREERKENDVVLVVIHGGNEHNPNPSPRMRKLYGSFADAGASAVINIHTHCPQGIEIRNGVPIIYCPGNFFFPKDQNVRPFNPQDFWWSGYLPRLSFDADGVYEIEVTPYVFSPNPWKVEALKDAQRQWYLNYLSHISELILTDNEYWFDVWCAARYTTPLSWLSNAPSEMLYVDVTFQEALNRLPPIRHAFTCQAHCELTKRCMVLMERKQMEPLKAELPKLAELRTAHFAEA